MVAIMYSMRCLSHITRLLRGELNACLDTKIERLSGLETEVLVLIGFLEIQNARHPVF